MQEIWPYEQRVQEKSNDKLSGEACVGIMTAPASLKRNSKYTQGKQRVALKKDNGLKDPK